MFDKLRKAFGRATAPPPGRQGPSSQADAPNDVVSEWAQSRGYALSAPPAGVSLRLARSVGGKPWSLEVGKPSRKYIEGDELRGRAELGVDEDVAVLVMSRALKDALEARAYSMIAGDLQTSADANLPEEMRWLAMYEEVGWDTLPMQFWQRFAVLSDRRENAMAWIDEPLAQALMRWRGTEDDAEVPFMMILLRGKAYLRMEHSPGDTATLQQAGALFDSACEKALSAFG